MGFSDTKAPYASFSQNSKGRLYPQDNYDDRSLFARDRDRVIHCMAFRRLKGKTQVFMSTDEDHMRTRLTHTLEVAQIARTLARFLRVDEDLTETIALSHDLGHPPYGHVGEDALAFAMQGVGGFDHNAHSLKIVTEIEHKYPTFNGLNLTWESLEGIVKHNGPLVSVNSPFITAFTETCDLRLDTYASLEAQIAAIADDVAYNHHDIDDGYRAGLFTLEDLKTIAHVKPVVEEVQKKYSTISATRQITEIVRRLLLEMVMDIKATTQANLTALAPQSDEDIRCAGKQIVALSPRYQAYTDDLRAFLFERVYRAPTIKIQRQKCWDKVTALYAYYTQSYDRLPLEWQAEQMGIGTGEAGTTMDAETGFTTGTQQGHTSHPQSTPHTHDTLFHDALSHDTPYIMSDTQKQISVGDYIAGMTDAYADRAYEKVQALEK